MQTRFDSDWRRRALAGEAGAVRDFVDDMMPPLYQFCLYRVGKDRHSCEEVVQETFARALRDLARYEPARAGGNIFPWLTGLARNEISRVLSRERRVVSLEELWQRVDGELLALFERLESEPVADDILVREETREMVNMTMSQLPVQYSQALKAKYVDGASVRDLASLWRTTEKAIESLLTRARKAFRATFTSLCGTLGAEVP